MVKVKRCVFIIDSSVDYFKFSVLMVLSTKCGKTCEKKIPIAQIDVIRLPPVVHPKVQNPKTLHLLSEMEKREKKLIITFQKVEAVTASLFWLENDLKDYQNSC